VLARSSTDTARVPRAGDPAAAERGLARWQRLSVPLDGPDAVAVVDSNRLLEAVFGNSTFLSEALLAEPDVLKDMLAGGPDETARPILGGIETTSIGNRNRLMTALRQSRRRMALLVALADIAGLWQLERVTGALSRFADLALQKALDQALVELAQRGELEIPDPEHPQESCGIFALGMGKLGAYELNYSSDVDLIVLFDAERFRYRGREGPMACAVRLTRTLVHLLEHRTRDGFVLRVDLRLRPHPPGQPLALSVEDAEQYYERHGQNWERAALIKARVVAGDRPAGERFLRWLQPFLWRKHLDYAAIRDIHSIKRQINAYRGHGSIRVAGHDLKVGRGGIREIEFFAQTQQLILGGRVPEARASGTCAALEALAEHRWIAPETAQELNAAYRFLRGLEHRLQMVADRQTHRLPEREDQLERFAAFAGFSDAAELDRTVRDCLERVEAHYAALFESSIDLGGSHSLVFTGTDDDPDTLATLREMGFVRPQGVAARVRAWHHGHIRATRDSRARELLTELMPRLLHALADQAEPDAAFARFDEFVSALPAGVQLFSLLRANPRLLMLLADIMGTAPRLGAHLSRHTSLFEAMLAPDFFEPLPERAALAAELEDALVRARDLQDELDTARRFAQGREFQIGLQVLLGLADGAVVGSNLTEVAEVVIQALLPRAQAWLSSQHGRVPGGTFVVLGLGKLGSRELTLGSDLDLIFVYDADDRTQSDGARPLAAPTYYARLSQRLISALTAQMPLGRLYDIDTRLRPSGNVGPVACSLTNFARYQRESAQTWEHQAMTRARVVAGDGALAARVEAVVDEAVRQTRDPLGLAREVGAMRERIFREHGDDDIWNLKHARGGLLEAEFLAQFLQLRFAPEEPTIRTTSAIETFERAAAIGAMSLEDSRLLIRALRLYQRLQAVLRLSVKDRFVAAAAPPGLQDALVRAAAPGQGVHESRLDFEGLQQALAASQAAVRRIFARVFDLQDDPSGPEDRRA
jgi:[glutamine synthetase] adenylyltransferase / [glutamine synthetase]-adenylyl-L-tyrosine phosphorylase